MVAKSFIIALLGLTSVSAACTGPAVNSATVSLITEFEGFRADICMHPTKSRLFLYQRFTN